MKWEIWYSFHLYEINNTAWDKLKDLFVFDNSILKIERTPEEFKGIFVTSEKQTDFTAVFFDAMQKSFMKQYFDMGNKIMSKFNETG